MKLNRKRNYLIFILLSTVCIGYYFMTQIYMYNLVQDETINITKYYNTGLFYIYTEPSEEPSESDNQRLIRKRPFPFWNKETVLKAVDSGNVNFLHNEDGENKNIFMSIMERYPDFSKKMNYLSSDAGFPSELSEDFIGYFSVDGVDYRIWASNETRHLDKSYYTEITKMYISISEGHETPYIGYQELLEAASKQKQP